MTHRVGDLAVLSSSLKAPHLPVTGVGTHKHTLTTQAVVAQLGLGGERGWSLTPPSPTRQPHLVVQERQSLGNVPPPSHHPLLTHPADHTPHRKHGLSQQHQRTQGSVVAQKLDDARMTQQPQVLNYVIVT